MSRRGVDDITRTCLVICSATLSSISGNLSVAQFLWWSSCLVRSRSRNVTLEIFIVTIRQIAICVSLDAFTCCPKSASQLFVFLCQAVRTVWASENERCGRLTAHISVWHGLQRQQHSSYATVGILRPPCAGKRWLCCRLMFSASHHISLVPLCHLDLLTSPFLRFPSSTTLFSDNSNIWVSSFQIISAVHSIRESRLQCSSSPSRSMTTTSHNDNKV